MRQQVTFISNMLAFVKVHLTSSICAVCWRAKKRWRCLAVCVVRIVGNILATKTETITSNPPNKTSRWPAENDHNHLKSYDVALKDLDENTPPMRQYQSYPLSQTMRPQFCRLCIFQCFSLVVVLSCATWCGWVWLGLGVFSGGRCPVIFHNLQRASKCVP